MAAITGTPATNTPSPTMDAAEERADRKDIVAPPSSSQDKAAELSMPQLAVLRRMHSPAKPGGHDALRPAGLALPRLPSPNVVSSFSPLISLIADSSPEVTPLERRSSHGTSPTAALAVLRAERRTASPRPRRPVPSASPSPAATSLRQRSPDAGSSHNISNGKATSEPVARSAGSQDKAEAGAGPALVRRPITTTTTATTTTAAGTSAASPPRARANTPCAHTQTRPFTDSPTFAQHRLALLGRSPMPSDLISVTRTLASCSPRSTTTVSSQDRRTRLRPAALTTTTATAIFPLHTPSTATTMATAAPHTARQATTTATTTTATTTTATNNNTNTTVSRLTEPIANSLLLLQHAQGRWVYGHHVPFYAEAAAMSARVGRETNSSHHHHHHHNYHEHRFVTPAGNMTSNHTTNHDDGDKTNHNAGTTGLSRPRTSSDFLLDRTKASFLIGCQKEEDNMHHHHHGPAMTLRLRGQTLDEVSAACRAAIDLRRHVTTTTTAAKTRLKERAGNTQENDAAGQHEGEEEGNAAVAAAAQRYFASHPPTNATADINTSSSKREASYVVLQREMCEAAANAVRASRSNSDMLFSVEYITLPETEMPALLPSPLSYLPPHRFRDDLAGVADVVSNNTPPVQQPMSNVAGSNAGADIQAHNVTQGNILGLQPHSTVSIHTRAPPPPASHLPPLGGPCALEHARLLRPAPRAGAYLPLARAALPVVHDTTMYAGEAEAGAAGHEEGRQTRSSSRTTQTTTTAATATSHNHQQQQHEAKQKPQQQQQQRRTHRQATPPSLHESSTTSHHTLARSHLEAYVEPSHTTRNASHIASVAESVARSMHRSASGPSTMSLVDSLSVSHNNNTNNNKTAVPRDMTCAEKWLRHGNAKHVQPHPTAAAPAPAEAADSAAVADLCVPGLGHLLTGFTSAAVAAADDNDDQVAVTQNVLEGLGLFSAVPLGSEACYTPCAPLQTTTVALSAAAAPLHTRRSGSRPHYDTHTRIQQQPSLHLQQYSHIASTGTVRGQPPYKTGSVYTYAAAEDAGTAPTPLFSHLMQLSSASPHEQPHVTPSLCQLLDIPGLS